MKDRPEAHGKRNTKINPIRNGGVYSEQYNFRMQNGGTLQEAKEAWLVKTGKTWLTPSQIAGVTFVDIPTVTSFEGRFNLKEWRRGGKRAGQAKRDRTVINNAADRMEEREAATLAVIEKTHPATEYLVEDHRKGIQNGADYAIVLKSTGKVVSLVDSKSGNFMSAFQVRTALQCEQEGVEYWLIDPEMSRAMKITSKCVFEPQTYKVYPPEEQGA